MDESNEKAQTYEMDADLAAGALQARERTFTAEEVIEIANETSDRLGNLYRLDFIDRIRHEARVLPPGRESDQ